MLRSTSRRKFPPKVEKRIVGEAFGYADLVQTVNTIKQLHTRFESDHARLMAQAERELAHHIRTTFKGDRGPQGPQGPQGQSIQGPKGERGAQGDKGDPGRDGKSPAIESITAKVLAAISLPKAPALKEIVDAVLKAVKGKLGIDDVKGLREELRQMQSKQAFAGGGGMGSIKFFKFTGDGVTTTFTLPDRPTQEGNATFAFSGGARMHNVEHFTVSGTTLTVGTAPEAGVIIDGFLIT